MGNTVTVIGNGSSTSTQRNTSRECSAERERTRVWPGPIASLDHVSPSVPGIKSMHIINDEGVVINVAFVLVGCGV